MLTAGRLGFDYGCLLAALRATGAEPQPSLVLLAYSAAGIIALFPVTPGGLGIVEASLSGLLILAGVRAGYAVLATLAYRIASYWVPLLAGPPAYLLFRHRYGRPVPAAPRDRGHCQVPDLKAVAGRGGGRAASRVGGEDDHAHRRDGPDVAEDARYALVKGFLAAVPGRDQRFHVENHRLGRQLPGLGEQVS